MLFKSRKEKAKENYLKAYENYCKAINELRKEAGWSFKYSMTISGNKETEAERNELVKALTEIDKRYNTTK